MMTVVAIKTVLLPICEASAPAARSRAAHCCRMIGGMISSTLLTLIVIPAIVGLVRGFRLSSSHHGDRQPQRGSSAPLWRASFY